MKKIKYFLRILKGMQFSIFVLVLPIMFFLVVKMVIYLAVVEEFMLVSLITVFLIPIYIDFRQSKNKIDKQ